MINTKEKYQKQIEKCKFLFEKKMIDYGSAWRVLRPTSLTDQIFIKAQRIRTIQNGNFKMVDEGEQDEFIGIINYSVLTIIQLDMGAVDEPDLDNQQTFELYNNIIEETMLLMLKKNHDYGEAWKEMRVSSLTDLILQKLYRVKKIENNQGKTLVSEGLKANFQDIINYAVFALIHLDNHEIT